MAKTKPAPRQPKIVIRKLEKLETTYVRNCTG